MLIPPSFTPYLSIQKNYETLTYQSPIHAWTPQPSYQQIMTDCQKLVIPISANQLLFIPPYWNYSFQLETKDTCICSFSYETVFNRIATSPHYVMQYLQTHNTI